MKHYLCRLLPPRADFVATMTAVEGAAMKQHQAYLHGLMEKGQVIAFGPVGDPKGIWGLALLALDDSADPAAITAADSVIHAGIGMRYEVLPMLALRTPA